MKKLLSSLLILSLLFAAVGCKSKPKEEERQVQMTIEVDEMRQIAELATMNCYFHNVAKSDRELNPEWYEFWKEKTMRFWVEYEGIVTVGIDVSKLKVEVSEDNVVTITMPPAVVLDVIVDESSLSSDSFYFDPNSKKPSPEEQSEAFRQAQTEMRETAESNYALMASAQANAKELLKNYVKSVGDALDVNYKIEWVYLDEEGKVTETEPDTAGEAKAGG